MHTRTLAAKSARSFELDCGRGELVFSFFFFLANDLTEFNYVRIRVVKQQEPSTPPDQRSSRRSENLDETFDLILLTAKYDRQEQQVKDPIEDERWCR